MTPTEWFDQFLPAVFNGDVGVDDTEQWCARHWAPAPLLGANGLQAAIMLFTQRMELGLSGYQFCCQLGDEQMYAIWGKCPPAGSHA